MVRAAHDEQSVSNPTKHSASRSFSHIIIHFSSPVIIRFKNGSISFRFSSDSQMESRSIKFFTVNWCGTQVSSFFWYPDLCQWFKTVLRACEIPWSVSKTVNTFFITGGIYDPKKSNTCSGDDVRRTWCYFLCCKCQQWWKKLFTVFDTDWVRGRWGGEVFHILLRSMFSSIAMSRDEICRSTSIF